MTPAPRRSDREELFRVDRRWFITAVAVFLASFAGLVGAGAIYRATGPHPRLGWLMRRIRFYSNAMMRYRPRFNRKS